jgi:hypothetical protein
MILEVLIWVVLLVGFVYATVKVWRGESEFDRDQPVAWWPFSVELWRGTGRAMPTLGLGTLLLIGGGIVGAMAVGFLGLLVMLFVGFPIMYFNRPKLFVPPPWRDDPPIYPRRRAQGAADQRRRDRG